MSEFKKYPSEYKDLDCLKAALVEHGCDEIEVHSTPTALKSYWGRNTKVDVSARNGSKVFEVQRTSHDERSEETSSHPVHG